MKILITGFDPFGGEPVNPAFEAVKLMKDEIAGAQIVKLEIPTVFGDSIEKVHAAMVAEKPDVVMSVGQAGGRFGVTPERVAINLSDARIPDNKGNQPLDAPIFEDGETGYLTTLPVKAKVCPRLFPTLPVLTFATMLCTATCTMLQKSSPT